MFKKRGIAFKTFVFTALLIGLVLTLSLGLLFMAMPDYYLYTKQKNLEKNADLLAGQLAGEKTDQEISKAIASFALANNAELTCYSNQNELLADISSPFVTLRMAPASIQKFSITIDPITTLPPEENHTYYTSIGLEDAANKSSAGERFKILDREQSQQAGKIHGAMSVSTITAKDLAFINITRQISSPLLDRVEIISTLQPIGEAMQVIWSLAPYLLAADLLIALLAAYLYAGRLTKPIIRLSQTAAQMQSMEPDISAALHTKDELGELSHNLDSLYQSLCSNIGRLKEEMERTSLLEQSKTDFMRAASHELKTPIAALNGIVEGMLDHVGKYRDRDAYLHESKKLIHRLTMLVNEILRASRLEQPESLLTEESFSPVEMIEAILARHEIFIEQKHLQISFDRQPVIVRTDPGLLENVLSNILSNAVRYTEPDGRILIGWEQSDQGYALWVENQCKPVPEEDLDKLFEPFYTISYSRNRDESGTGLGLYIARKNLEALKLPYSLESTSLGLRFTVTLVPQAPDQSPQ